MVAPGLFLAFGVGRDHDVQPQAWSAGDQWGVEDRSREAVPHHRHADLIDALHLSSKANERARAASRAPPTALRFHVLMRLLVTGGAGMLGRAVVAAATRLGHDVVAPASAELDVTDLEAVRGAMRAIAPAAVINCAAWTDVDGAETSEAAALAVNGEGAGNVARAVAEAGARVVHVSTDYVFDGSKREPWVESDPVSPLSAYGRTKLAGEQAVAAAAPEHAIVRTAWLFGAGGPNFVETMLRLGAEREEVSVVIDQVGRPTWTGHLAPALVELAERPGEVGVFHAAGEGHCSWNEFAIEIFDRAGMACRVLPVTTDEFPRPARRPAYSVLGTERTPGFDLPAWQEGLKIYLAQRERDAVLDTALH
jgi:dTDP-4-dehydrorhamnose reductase